VKKEGNRFGGYYNPHSNLAILLILVKKNKHVLRWKCVLYYKDLLSDKIIVYFVLYFLVENTGGGGNEKYQWHKLNQ